MPDLTRIRTLLDQRRPNHTLPRALYVDPDVHDFDLEAIFGHSWVMLGFEVELPAPGAYLSAMIGRSPVLVIRGRDGVLRGFHNSCRHRGAQLCEPGTGRRPRIVCPYHQWVYDLDGALLKADRMAPDFDPATHGLRPIQIETVAGSIYACLADDPPDFAPFRDAVGPLLEPHDLLNAKVAVTGTLVEAANWKLVMENARECYHCAVRHPELSRTFPVDRKSLTEDEERHITDAFAARMERMGLGVGPVEGAWWQAGRFPLNPGVVSLTMDGAPVVAKPLGAVGDGDVGSLRWALEPNSFAHALGDYVFFFSAMPTAPLETLVTAKWLVHKDAVEGVDYHPDRLAELWNRTNDQDRQLAELNQRGVNSVGYVPGPYSEEAESLVARFTDWYCTKARAFVDGAAAAKPDPRSR
jgi:Rieske 2Fe-2S family protein